MAATWAVSGCLSPGRTGCRRSLRAGSASRSGGSGRDDGGYFVATRRVISLTLAVIPGFSCVVDSHKQEVAAVGEAELRARRAALTARLPEAGGFVSGTLVEQHRKCGKEGCRCTQGELHGPYTYLQVSGRLVYVPAGLAETVARQVGVGAAAGPAGGDLRGQPGAAVPPRAGLGDDNGGRTLGAETPAGCGVLAELAAPLANMLEAALAGGCPAPEGRYRTPASGRLAMMRGEQKITSGHLDRSDDLPAPVHPDAAPRARRVHRPSVRAGGRAARLGWAPGRVEVIDCDLGLSGRTATHREGFRELLGRVCAARPARSSRWRSPGWPALTPTCRGYWRSPG